MDSRKLQKTGGSTMIVSLPKKWIDDSNLNQGSEAVSYTHLTLPTIYSV